MLPYMPTFSCEVEGAQPPREVWRQTQETGKASVDHANLINTPFAGLFLQWDAGSYHTPLPNTLLKNHCIAISATVCFRYNLSENSREIGHKKVSQSNKFFSVFIVLVIKARPCMGSKHVKNVCCNLLVTMP